MGALDPVEKKARPVHTFEIPASLALQYDVTTIGLVEINQNEELMAAKRAGGDGTKLAYELAKSALVEVNDQKVSLADGSVDKAFNDMGPKVRQLVLTAYVNLHNVAEADSASFLSSQKVRV